MRRLLNYSSLLLACTSCTFDDNGDPHISPWFWIILVGFIILVVIAGIQGNKDIAKVEEKLGKDGLKLADFKSVGSYVGGHPEINEIVSRVVMKAQGSTIEFYSQESYMAMPKLIFSMPQEAITSIDIEDASTMEKKITVGRIFLVGIFALGWRKKKKNELAFIVIGWNDGRFDHHTTFSFETKDAMTLANKARNELIKACKEGNTVSK